ncbi:MAG TPA: SDR family NAD(P)-dependent oxidoreductase, partial [Mycolicibacterium fallax]|nr:SDR family NAD(P)-dependent oxidoreductase [Mycolicibacterium fallax]
MAGGTRVADSQTAAVFAAAAPGYSCIMSTPDLPDDVPLDALEQHRVADAVAEEPAAQPGLPAPENTVIGYPGHTADMPSQPDDEMRGYTGTGLLAGKRALITGGDSGIGRATAVAFAKEGADVVIAYLQEHGDAAHTAELVEREGRRCLALAGDLGQAQHCRSVVSRTAAALGGIDILVNNAGYQNPADDLTDITDEQ